MAAYGTSSGVVASGYGSGAGLVTAGQAHQLPPSSSYNSHGGRGRSSIPPLSYSAHPTPSGQQQNIYSPDIGDDASPPWAASASSVGGNHAQSPATHEYFEMPPTKRQKVSDAGIFRRPSHSAAHSTTASPAQQRQMEGPSLPPLPRGGGSRKGIGGTESRRGSEAIGLGASPNSPAVIKPKRVRTGCLTCRNRHLKCDEAMPVCLNCQKSNRKCERGVRLNFIDLKVEQPPFLLPPVDWKG